MNEAIAAPAAVRPLSRRYVNYVMLMIFLVAIFNTGDRTIMSVMVDDIKAELQLDDRQMGFVLGFAFSFVHMVFGIPLARLADRVSCKKVVALSLFGWSLMTALVGAAQNFAQLVAVRMGVGIGEAGGSPACHALIATHVDPGRRARAMSVLSIGALAGLGLGAVYGGWANAQFGWRFAFISAGLPGVLLALLFWFTVRDTRVEAPAEPGENLLRVLRGLFGTPSFVWLIAAASFATMTTMGRTLWEPTLLRRVYAIDSAQVGMWYFAISILPSAIGAFAGAWLIDRLAGRDQRWYAWGPALASLAMVAVAPLFYLWPETQTLRGVPVAFVFCIALSMLGGIWAPATMTLAQVVVSPRARAVGAACWTMIANFIGYGLGALLVGDLSIRFEPAAGEHAIRYALLGLASLSVVSALLYHQVARALGAR